MEEDRSHLGRVCPSTFFYAVTVSGYGGFYAVCDYGSIRGHFYVFMLVPELAEISFGHEELSMVVLAVKLALMCRTVRWGDDTTSMATLEAGSVV